MDSIEIRPVYLLNYKATGMIVDERPGYALVSFYLRGFKRTEWICDDHFVEKGSYSIGYTSSL